MAETCGPGLGRQTVADDPHRRPDGPIDGEQVGAQGVFRTRADDPFLVIGMGEGFLRRQERRAAVDPCRAQRQSRDQRPSRSEPARGNHRNGYRPHDLGNQNQRRCRAVDMPAGLHPLGDDHVGAGLFGQACVLDRADLMEHQATMVLGPLDDVRIDIPEQADRMHTGIEAGRQFVIEQLGIGRGRDQVDPERPVRAVPHGLDLLADQIRAFAHHAEETVTAGTGHRTDQVRPRDAAHPRLKHRVAAAEQRAECRFHHHSVHGPTHISARVTARVIATNRWTTKAPCVFGWLQIISAFRRARSQTGRGTSTGRGAT